MRILRKIEDMDDSPVPISLAIGMLDGVHIGHQRVLRTTVDHARERSAQAWVLTFEPHPRKMLAKGEKALLLTSLPHKLRLIESLSTDGCILEPFTPQLRQLTPEEFFRHLTDNLPGLSEIVVGQNWTFGKNAAGDVETLRGLASAASIAVTVVEPVLAEGKAVSSTRIREAITAGRLDEAKAMLGRPFSVLGTVVPGHKIGRDLGYPTANIDTSVEVEPPPGIYAVCAMINGKRHNGVAYYGSRPTFDDESHNLVLEVHLFDGSFELYSKEMEIFFLEYIRPDRKFGSQTELIQAIHQDCAKARQIVASTSRTSI